MMFHGKAIGLVLAGLIGGAAIGGPLAVGAAEKWGGCPLLESPLGKLVSGNLGRWMVLRSELNLTAEQREKIRQVIVAHKPEIARAAKGVFERRVALREAVLGEKGESAVRQAADGLAKSIGDAAVLASKVAGEVKPVLSDKQRKAIRQTRGACDGSIARFLDEAMKAQ